MEKNEETEIVVECFILDVCFYSTHLRRTGVERSMLNVGRSSFKTTSYGINSNCERQNNFAIMPLRL